MPTDSDGHDDRTWSDDELKALMDAISSSTKPEDDVDPGSAPPSSGYEVADDSVASTCNSQAQFVLLAQQKAEMASVCDPEAKTDEAVLSSPNDTEWSTEEPSELDEEDELSPEFFEQELKKAANAGRADATAIPVSDMGGGGFLTFSFIIGLIGFGLGAFAVWSLQGIQSALDDTRLLIKTQTRELGTSKPTPPAVHAIQQQVEQLDVRLKSMQAQIAQLEARPAVEPQTKTPASISETPSVSPPETVPPSKQMPTPAVSKAAVADNNPTISAPSWQVRVAVFSKESRAQMELERLAAKGFEIDLKPIPREGKKTLYRLRSKGFPDHHAARKYADRLRKYGVQPQIVKVAAGQ